MERDSHPLARGTAAQGATPDAAEAPDAGTTQPAADTAAPPPTPAPEPAPDSAAPPDPTAEPAPEPIPAPELALEPIPEPDPETREDPLYGPIPLRYRHDGWVPDRQIDFIHALTECGCVDEAARSVGMSRTSAYALRRRPDAQAFRLAWDMAMEQAVDRLSDVALGRAINGVAVPVFHNGEQVGERRHYDERLTMFLLRTRRVSRHGTMAEKELMEADDPDRRVNNLNYRIGRMIRAAWRNLTAAEEGQPAPRPVDEPKTPADFIALYGDGRTGTTLDDGDDLIGLPEAAPNITRH